MTDKMRVRSSCKGSTDGQTRGKAYRLGRMGEASVQTESRTASGFVPVTEAKLRMHEDGSGLFEFRRGNRTFSVRWNDEDGELDMVQSGTDIPAVEIDR